MSDAYPPPPASFFKPVRPNALSQFRAGWLCILVEALAIALLAFLVAALSGPAVLAHVLPFTLAIVPLHLALCYLARAMPDLPNDRRTGAALRASAAAFLGLVCFGMPMLPASIFWGATLWLLTSAALGLVALGLLRRFATRLAFAGWVRRAIRPAAVVGGSDAALQILPALAARGYEVSGFYDDRIARTGPLTGTLPRLGSVSDLIASAEDEDLTDVFLAFPWSAGDRIAEVSARLRFLPITLRLVPDQPAPLAVERESTPDLFMPVLMRPPMSPTMVVAKEVFDRVTAAILILLMAPLFLTIAVLIRLDSPGPVLFRQWRIGRFGRRFQIFKFRSLRVEAADQDASRQVAEGDTRVTKIGWTLRKFSLDELPQLLNVLRGDMSMVGPRPHAPGTRAEGRLFSDVIPDYPLRYRVKPGLTGWAQINGWRGQTDTVEKLRQRVEFDFAYIRDWSPWTDFLILLRTLPAVLRPPSDNR